MTGDASPAPRPGSEARDLFAGSDRGAWLNTAYQGLLPAAAVKAGEEALAWKVWPDDLPPEAFDQVPSRARDALAALLGGKPEEIALGSSTSYGLHVVATGLPLREGDEVLLFGDDFPASHLPWTGLPGVEPRTLPRRFLHETRELRAAIAPRTRLACFTWVSSFSGDVAPWEAARMLRERGVAVVLNVAQGAGILPLDLAGAPVDAVAGCGWKWLLGPYGTGFLWTRPSFRSRLAPHRRYWRALDWNPADPRPQEPFEEDGDGAAEKKSDRPGRPGAALPGPLPERWPLDAFAPAAFTTVAPWVRSLELLAGIGSPALHAHNRALVDRLRTVLEGGPHRVVSPPDSPLVILEPAGSATEWALRLRQRGVQVAVRGGRLRAAPHLYNTADDIDALLEVLAP